MINVQQYYQSLLSSVWPEWKITRRLGKGNYGSVYEIQRDDLGIKYKCALKILHIETDGSPFSHLDNTDMEMTAGENHSKRIEGSFQLDNNASDSQLNKTFAALNQGTFKIVFSGEKSTDESASNSSDGYPEEELEDFVRSVSTEIDMMMQLKGAPHIVSIEDYAIIRKRGSRTILIRMELLESMNEYFRRCGLPGKREVIQLGVDICTALEHCEQKNILHRDIKPSNIFYSEQSGFKLGDFGISRTMSSIYSRMSMTGVGTIQYMAPEVYGGYKYNNTVDIYSLGVVLYTLMNENKPPFYVCEESESDASAERSRIYEANMRRLRGETLPFPAHADDAFGKVICKACNPDPSQRFQSAASFKSAIIDENSNNNVAKTPSPVNAPFDISKFVVLLASLICVLCVVAYFAISNRGSRDTSAEVSYRVLYEDEDGNLLEEKTGHGRSGEKIELYGLTFDGYTLTSSPSTEILLSKEEDNEFIFKYVKTDNGIASDYSAEDQSATLDYLDEKLTFSDPALEKAICSALGIVPGNLTRRDALNRETLDISGGDKADEDKITDLTGLSAFANLKELDLKKNRISDIGELATLIHLEKLEMENNQISDLEPLRNLVNLEKLYLFDNKVADISPICGLRKLKKLDVIKNQLSSINGIGGMDSLVVLRLGRNQLTDISPVVQCQDLKELGFGYNNVEDISCLYKLPMLRLLTMNGNKIKDIGPIANMPELYHLEIAGNPIEDYSPLDKLPESIELEK